MSISHVAGDDANPKLRRSILHEFGAVPLCLTSTFSSHLQESEEWIRELPMLRYVNLSISDHNDDEQRMPWSHTPSGPPLDVDSVFFHLSLTQLGDPSSPALLSRPFFDSIRWGRREDGKIVQQTSWFEFARGFETKEESRSKIAHGDNCGGAVAKTQVRCRTFGLKIVIRISGRYDRAVGTPLMRHGDIVDGLPVGGLVKRLLDAVTTYAPRAWIPLFNISEFGLPLRRESSRVENRFSVKPDIKCIKNSHRSGTHPLCEINKLDMEYLSACNGYMDLGVPETAGILAAKVSMRIQQCFFTFRSRVRPEARPIPDAFLLNSRGCGRFYFGTNAMLDTSFSDPLALGSVSLLTGTFDGVSVTSSGGKKPRHKLLLRHPADAGGPRPLDLIFCRCVLRSCMFHPHHPSWLVDAGALPASPAVQRIVVLGDPDVRLVHPLLNNPLFARTVLVVPSSNPAKWTPVGEYSSSASLVILRTNKKRSKGGALHLLSVLQRAARTPLKPVKQYSQYDYEGREETFGFVPMSTMAEDTSEVESAGVLPIPSFHAVINFLDGRSGSEREALRTGILTTSLVGGFLLTGNGKGKTQVTAPRRASRLSFLSRRPSPTLPTATGEEAEHGAEERCAHVIHVIPPSATLPSKTVQNLEHFLINHCRTAASTSSLPAPISTAKSVTHYAYILPFNLLLSSHGPNILDFALAGALDGGGSKAWIRSIHDVRVTGGSVKMHGSGLPTPPDSEEELGGVKGAYQLSDSPPLNAEEERRRTLRALEKGKGRQRVGSTLGQNPIRSDGTGENARRPTSRDRRRSERSKLEHTPRSPTVTKPHAVHHTYTHARTPSDTHVSQALPSLPTPRNTPPVTMKSNATWNAREKPLPRILRRKEVLPDDAPNTLQNLSGYDEYTIRVTSRLMSFGKRGPSAPEMFTLWGCLALGLSAEASVKVYPLYEQASHALSRREDLLYLASIQLNLRFDNRVEIRRR
ncbi:hypothetical protein IW261DRAFT_1422746 [Armillaria novae-zelandiae]|uniref:Uncharacterized protein n=1 Tax=Armillaria novae-zelandiae TaxID=153914 RepID=A0AA39P0R4_9AGAR|nr:hypothetical protein IW261DRAFT_1422746 [Armillaria novae-zelandiae]